MYGDVNGDNSVDLKDVLLLKRHLAGTEITGFQEKNADVDKNGTVNKDDVTMLKRYLAEQIASLDKEKLTVSFYDGERLLHTSIVEKDDPLGALPDVTKTSKTNAVFAGWYTDAECTTPFYADVPVTQNMKVYAKYDELQGSELTVTSFAQMDMYKKASFTVVGSGDTSAITLTAKDGSDPVELSITGSDPYTIIAKDGFKEGASYELTLPEGLNFVGTEGKTLPDSVRTASFSIKKEAVDNLKLSDDIHYVRNADPSGLKEGNSVTLAGAKVGDLICFYKTTNPKVRDYKSSAYMDDPETWFKVGAVNGDTVTLAKLEDSDSEKMYEVPDNFPVKGERPTEDSGTLTLTPEDSDGYKLDTEFYKQMVENATDATLTYANEKVSVGDFISIYTSTDKIDEANDIYFGKITAYDSSTGVITYTKSSAEEIEASMDLYVQPALKGNDLLSEKSKEEIEQKVLAQIQESGFAEEAGFMLAELATRTDGFRNMEGAQVLFSDENGKPLSDEEIELLNLGKSFELKDGVDLKVEIITSGDQLHYKDKGSVQLGIGIDAQFEVDVEDGGKVVIDLSATFVQELAIGVTANGELVKKKILFIPIPIGVKIGSSVDLLSYTGVRVDVHAYTVAEKDKKIWEQLEEVAKNPKKLAEVLPANDEFAAVKEGLETVGDVFDKIDEVKGKIEQVRDNAEKAKEYTEDLAMLWEMVGAMNQQGENLPTEDKWEEMGKTLGKTNISKDLMDMLDLSTETGLDADRYADSLEDLLTKYSEMLEKETDWVKLVQEEMCKAEVNLSGFVIYVKADFVVRADMNIAMGASIQYQVGKRYNFWVKVGLFKPEAGSSTMDLVDEEFAFQFYVMGKLGIKMGVEATAGFAIGSADVARVGVHLELGPYVKLYGFFIYEYERSRGANTSAWVSNERMAGALYVDFGLYLIVGVDAAALDDMFEVSYDFIDTEFPLLEAGEKRYPYAFQYEPQEDEFIVVRDEDGNSNTGVTMTLPEECLELSYCNLQTGQLGARAYTYDKFNYEFSNPNFTMDKGKISVNVPEGTRYMECDMTVTYKYGKLAFSDYDMQVTIPLVWTSLSDKEITERYTASVRVGNAIDGYDTVWSYRVLKNQEITLPTEDEIKELAGYSAEKYESFSFPDAGKKISLVDSKAFDCEVTYKNYELTVQDVQKADGSTESQTFTTHYGEAFDFSKLQKTGTNLPNVNTDQARFTKFVNVSTEAKIPIGQDKDGATIEETIDLTKPISSKVAQAIAKGSVVAKANYADDSVLVTYQFTGIDVPKHEERIRKGTVSDYDFSTIVAEQGMMVKNISPAFGAVYSSVNYIVECGEIVGDKYKLTFEENGGSEVTDIERVGGSLIGNLPTPVRAGYAFVGWFADEALTMPFAQKLMPKENITLYAKWERNAYTVTFNVNGGNNWTTAEEGTTTVNYGAPYGSLPVPTRSDYGFVGWFTEPDGGTEVTADTIVERTEHHTLYAHWKVLKTIPTEVFDFGTAETVTYTKGQEQKPEYAFHAGTEGVESYKESDFTFKYMRQGNSEYESGLPINAGTYDVVVSRDADNEYAKFEYAYTAVLTINKATRTLSENVVSVSRQGYSFVEVTVNKGLIDDLSDQAKFEFSYTRGKIVTEQTKVILDKLLASNNYSCSLIVKDDPNYEDTSALSFSFAPKSAPTESWSLHRDTEFTVPTSKTEYVLIETAEQLAQLAYLVNNEGKDFSGYTFILGKDIDLTGYKWTPIGTESRPFKGIFNGSHQVIRGMYVNGSENLGLFGVVQKSGTGSTKLTGIHLSESYVKGEKRTGAIAGWIKGDNNTDKLPVTDCMVDTTTIYSTDWGAGGIAGVSEGGVLFDRCVNYAYLTGVKEVGGIVGLSSDAANTINVRNCVNYGRIEASYDKKDKWTNGSGGIVGSLWQGNVINCVNFGDIKGGATVGGVVGTNLKKAVNCIYNCYSAGSVYSTSKAYVAAVIGRNESSNGKVFQCYYLKDSAQAGNVTRKASGTKDGCDPDKLKDIDCAYFTSPDSDLIQEEKTVGKGCLIETLNDWVTANGSQDKGMGSAGWTTEGGWNGYPIPLGIPTLSK